MENIFVVFIALFVFLWCTGAMLLATYFVRNIKTAELLPHQPAVLRGDIYR